MKKDDLVYLAWGVNNSKSELATRAVEVLEALKVKILKKNQPHYHPLVRPNPKKKIADWRDQAKKIIKQSFTKSSLKKREFGFAKGKIKLSADFDEPVKLV